MIDYKIVFSCFSDCEDDSNKQASKKAVVFANKKDAIDAFKALLRDKVIKCGRKANIPLIAGWCN